MQTTALTILTILYGIGGIATFIGFMPTIRDLWNKKPSANATTYWIWTTTTLITSLYGFFILDNLVFNLVINFQLFACVIILYMRLRLPK
jgi:hypothetical protein